MNLLSVIFIALLSCTGKLRVSPEVSEPLPVPATEEVACDVSRLITHTMEKYDCELIELVYDQEYPLLYAFCEGTDDMSVMMETGFYYYLQEQGMRGMEEYLVCQNELMTLLDVPPAEE